MYLMKSYDIKMSTDVSYSVKSSDIMKARPRTKITLYSDIHELENLDELFGKDGTGFLLYEKSPRNGHWTCLIKHKKKIEFFDSLGYFPDDELKKIPMAMRKLIHEYFPYLVRLLDDYGWPVEYNHTKLQKNKPGVNTCGRWCLNRCVWKQISLESYVESYERLKEEGYNLDEFIAETQPV